MGHVAVAVKLESLSYLGAQFVQGSVIEFKQLLVQIEIGRFKPLLILINNLLMHPPTNLLVGNQIECFVFHYRKEQRLDGKRLVNHLTMLP